MKTLLYLGLISTAFGLLAARTTDVLTDTGVSMDNIREDVLTNLTAEQWFSFNSTGAMRRMAKRIPEGSRATAVRALGRVVRSYVESGDFNNQYLDWVRGQYRVDERYSDEAIAMQEKNLNAVDGVVTEQLTMMEQAYAQMDPAMLQMAIRMQVKARESELASMDAEQRARELKELADVKKILTATEGKPAEFKKQFMAYTTRQLKQDVARNVGQEKEKLAETKQRNGDYRKQKAEFDAHADYRPLLRQRLKDFIALCSDVNFDAKVTTQGYRREFVDAAYTSKPAEWKFLYRLGKEPVMEARAFAREWLTDLEKTTK
ncbi:hypothetical protein DYU11_23295 [Fibrisoma montanum]|uniref:DUF3826 domain-containing protein n=1 Tax=Fibrisoma montanum TaxID=2305895 RepID=A0A418M2B2_9BACT|nr:hypothetical protein [Fibrisoma montanum]RIV19851.1 hypothetical protein DYU11_23295 [Fibrisoma montanum]